MRLEDTPLGQQSGGRETVSVHFVDRRRTLKRTTLMPDLPNGPKLAEEVELKFAVPPGQVAALRKRSPLPRTNQRHKTGRRRRQRLLSVYFDTPDLELRQRGIGLRVRHVDGRRLQTVKCDSPASPAGRLECEHEIAGDRPDPTCIEESGLRDYFSDIGAPARLYPVFSTNIDRTAWQFRHRGAAIECALDVGEIRSGDMAIPIHELELELKSRNTRRPVRGCRCPQSAAAAADGVAKQRPAWVCACGRPRAGAAVARKA